MECIYTGVSMKKILFILLLITLLVTGCSNDYNEEIISIDNTFSIIESIDGRLVGSDGNFEFAEKLKGLIKNYENDNLKLYTQKYDYKTLDSYKFVVEAENTQLIIDESNSYVAILDENINKDKKILLESLNLINKQVDKNQIVTKIGNVATTTIYINQNIEAKLKKLPKNNLNITFEPQYGSYELENIYTLIKGKSSSNAIVITAHYDSYGGVNNNPSKGAIDNGSGIAIVLELIKNFSKDKRIPENDLIFAFVNSEEGMSVTGGGSKVLSEMLNENYESIFNINLDCLGQKDLNTVFYGLQGNINNDFFSQKLNEIFSNDYSVVKTDFYPSDHLNFTNSMYIHNIDYGDKLNKNIHKNDNVNNIDMTSLKNISEKISKLISDICYTEDNKLLYSFDR